MERLTGSGGSDPETREKGGRRVLWTKATPLIATFAALVWSGIKVGMDGSLDLIEYLVVPVVLLPGLGYVLVASVRRLGQSERATSRVWMIPWTAACVAIVSLSLVLLFVTHGSFAAFVYGAVVAPVPFFFVLLVETELGVGHSAWVWDAGLVLFALEWAAIWAAGMLRLRKRRPVPLTALVAGHWGLGMAVLAALGLVAAATGSPG